MSDRRYSVCSCDTCKARRGELPAHPKTADPSTQEESQPKENKPPAVTFMLELTREELTSLTYLLRYLRREWPQMLNPEDVATLGKAEELR